MARNSDYIKGESGIKFAEAFAVDFPLPEQEAPDREADVRILTTETFDHWAARHGFYSLDADRDTINNWRNKLRHKINRTAISEAWQSRDMKPFHVQVHGQGRLAVVSAEFAFNTKANKLPDQVKSLVKHKSEALHAMRASVDFNSLPIGLQLRIDRLGYGIDDFVEIVTFHAERHSAEFRRVQAEIERLIERGSISQRNLSARTVLDVPPDDDDDDMTDEEDSE